MGSSNTDRTLIRRTREGRLDAFDELMRRYERLVYKLAYGYCRTSDDALDIAQEVFLKVYRGLDRFDGPDSGFKAWLTRITLNEGVNWTRRNKRHSQGREPVDTLDTAATTPAHEAQEHDVLTGERTAIVMRAMQGLNARQRLALELRYFHELPIREIATTLECTEGTVKNILFRGVRKLRDRVAPAI